MGFVFLSGVATHIDSHRMLKKAASVDGRLRLTKKFILAHP